MATDIMKVFSTPLGTNITDLLGMLGQKLCFLQILMRRAKDNFVCGSDLGKIFGDNNAYCLTVFCLSQQIRSMLKSLEFCFFPF